MGFVGSYPCMPASLLEGIPLGREWALQHPQDYLETIRTLLPEIISDSGVDPVNIIGMGIDFTSCTLLPIADNGTPLCMLHSYQHKPHAWVKLWKHHSAQPEADRITEVAQYRNEYFIDRYGGKVSSEFFFPKVLQIMKEDKEIYQVAKFFVEAGDWVVHQLISSPESNLPPPRNTCAAGFKSFWQKKSGFPQKEFFTTIHPDWDDIFEKMTGMIGTPGTAAGYLNKDWAQCLGLLEGLPISYATIDAHAAVVGSGVVTPGRLVIVMGTSGCHMLLSETEVRVPGICGMVEDGIVPGLFAYEAGQAAMGDLLSWFVNRFASAEIREEAEKKQISIYQCLEDKADTIVPGQSGLIALDWWNGNLSVLNESNLTGLILGMTLEIKPEEIYLSLFESLAFGTRRIVEQFEASDMRVDEIIACGGLPEKSPLMMQILADVLRRPIQIAGTDQASALGAAVYAAVSAGSKTGGYDTLEDAALKMTRMSKKVYRPRPSFQTTYNELIKFT